MGLALTSQSGYNPPKYVLDAAKDALNHVDCNQYAPTKVRVGQTPPPKKHGPN